MPREDWGIFEKGEMVARGRGFSCGTALSTVGKFEMWQPSTILMTGAEADTERVLAEQSEEQKVTVAEAGEAWVPARLNLPRQSRSFFAAKR